MGLSSWSFWLYATTLLSFALPLGFYGLRSDWRASRVGKGLLALYASIVAILALVTVSYLGWVPDDVRAVLRVVTLSGVQLAGWWQLANILRAQRRDRCATSVTPPAAR